MLSILTGVIGAILFSIHFFQLGSLFRKCFPDHGRISEGIYSIAFGMILFLVFLLVIGSFGVFTAFSVSVFIAVIFALRLSAAGSWLLWLKGLPQFFRCMDRPQAILSAVLGAFFALTFVLCFVPETGNDALCYQLNVPKYFVWQHSLWPMAYDANSYIPMAMNCFYAVGLLFKSVMLAKYFHWLTGVVTILLLIRVLRSDSVSHGVALAMGLLLFLTPVFANEVTTTYVDVATGFFMLIAIVLMRDGFAKGRGIPIFLSGLAMSMVIAAKFSLLILLLPMFVLGCFLAFQFRAGWRTLKYLLFFSFGAILICGFWFLRNYGLVQNPFFPYFGEFFGTIGMKNYSTYLDPGIPKNLWNLATLPWQLTFHPDAFGRSHWLGPLPFLMVPAVVTAVLKRRSMPFFIVAVLGTILWFYTTQASRYLLPVLPAWCIVAGSGISVFFDSERMRAIFQRIATVALAGVLTFLSAVTVYHYRYDFLFLVGRWSQDRYLENLERTWPIARWINGNLPPSARIFNVEEIRVFYFDRDLVRERNFNFFTSYSDRRTPEQVVEYLKGCGFTHILMSSGLGAPASESPSSAFEGRIKKIREIVNDHAKARQIADVESKNIRDVKYDYKLYELI